MHRIGIVTVEIHNDVLGKPYLVVEGSEDQTGLNTVLFRLYADMVSVKDYRPKEK